MYSPLDQYLMGIRDKADVPPQFVVSVGDVAGAGSASMPIAPGKSNTISGTRLDFTIDDVRRAEGPRVPALEPCHWTAAFLVVHAVGQPPSAAQLAKVDAYRARWETFYSWATDGRGSVDTTLDNRGKPSCSVPLPADAGMAREAGARDAQPREAGARRDGSARDATHGDAAAPSPAPGAGGCSCVILRAPGRDAPLALLLLALLLLPLAPLGGVARGARSGRRR